MIIFLLVFPTTSPVQNALIFVFTVLAALITIAVKIAKPHASRLGKSVSVIKNLVSGKTNPHAHELVVDRSGLTIRRPPVTTHLTWRHIGQIGVLKPERGALNHRLAAADQYARVDVLVVQLRPEVPAPSGLVSVLSDEHRQLGYLGLCAVGEFGCSRQEMISALERFAGGKLVHSSRQFLDRDPRLRPEMV